MNAPTPVPPPADDLPPGFTLGHYALQGKLGQGGMGTVYRAVHLRLERVVALKVLSIRKGQHARALARFNREVTIAGNLHHPHVIRATDAGEAAGHAYLVMDLVDGLDLYHLIGRAGPLRLADACELARQTADGLHYIHTLGLIHRDVKPSNILLGRDGQVRLLDLGLSRLCEGAIEDERLTDTGEVMGTADYMAPEQGTDSKHVDVRADLYSLGCTLYCLLAGRPPFSGPEYSSRFKKLLAHQQTPIPPIRERRGEVPDQLAAVLDHLLAKLPAERIATSGEAREAMAPFTAGSDLVGLMARFHAGSPRPA